ncbi:MAG: ATP-binding protein [Fibrobacterota bacterium]|nr:sensor histidine kinase KdpD [Chitinispirillaceae bacterium]
MNERTDVSQNVKTRGSLKIFLGMCAGVGKTYAMLEEAHKKIAEGVDVVAGLVVTHKRAETEALRKGIPQIPLKQVPYHGVIIDEIDIDVILSRKPRLVLVDELPHTNTPGCRHPKRYQDVLELLDAGIDVYTALNVQHIESRADVVQGIVSVRIHETVPDLLIDIAEEIQLIDITPEELRARLSNGKVYLGDRIVAANDNFFKPENLAALREIALRIMAEKIGQDVRDVMMQQQIKGPWKSSERYLVAVGPSPFSEPLIRWTRRIAAATHSHWIAVHVDNMRPYSEEEKERLQRNLSLVKQLGGETVTISGEDIAEAILQTAHDHNVTQIVIGKPPVTRFNFFRKTSLVDTLILKSGDIDVCVVRADKKNISGNKPPFFIGSSDSFVKDMISGLSVIAVCTLFFLLFKQYISYTSISILYLLVIVTLATKLVRRSILLIAAITGLLWNFLFIPPVYTFRIDKVEDILMFSVFIIVALIVGNLTVRLRMRELVERQRERRTHVLYNLAQCVVESHTLDEGLRMAIAHIDMIFKARSAITLVNDNGVLDTTVHGTSTLIVDTKEQSVITWVHGNAKPAGYSTDTLPEASALHIPLRTTHGAAGVLSLQLEENTVLDVAERELLETIGDHVAALIDRYRLIRQTGRMQVTEESEKLYRILFDSVSHELKTPIAVLSAAVDQTRKYLNANNIEKTLELQNEMSKAITRLKRSVDNMIGMTRLEAGPQDKNHDWCALDEIVVSASEQVADLLNVHEVNISIEDDLPLIKADPVLMTQVISNLLINAAQYSEPHLPVTIVVQRDETDIILKVIDEGPGIPEDELNGKLFTKFYRGKNAKAGGTGLGLSIVARFMDLIGGRVAAANNSSGKGATFTLHFPIQPNPEVNESQT